MAGEHQIRGGFRIACGCIGINALAGSGLVSYPIPTHLALARYFRRGRQIEDHLRAGQGVHRRGRNRCKQVFTDFDAQKGVCHGIEGLAVHKDRAPCKSDGSTFRGGAEPAAFTEFTVICQICLGSQAAQFATGDHGCAVKDLHAIAHRQTDHNGQLRKLSRTFQNFYKAGFHRIMERVLQKQIRAAVAGHGQFRKQQHIHILRIRLGNKLTNILGILFNIGYLHLRNRTGNTNIIQHGIPPLH